MQAVDRGAGLRAFRMDDRRQRLVIDSTMPENTRYFGWEVANAEALPHSLLGWSMRASQ
jgi:hypothetical protein